MKWMCILCDAKGAEIRFYLGAGLCTKCLVEDYKTVIEYFKRDEGGLRFLAEAIHKANRRLDKKKEAK